MKRIDYSFLDSGMLPAEMVNLTAAVSALNASLKANRERYPRLFEDLEREARAQVVINTMKVEGIVVPPERAELLLARQTEPRNREEGLFAGYRDAMDYVNENYESMDLSVASIKKLHELMFRYDDSVVGGQYRTQNEKVELIHSECIYTTAINACCYSEIETAMDELMAEVNVIYNSPRATLLLLTPCFVVDFLKIKPFNKGNGKVARAMIHLLMYKEGYEMDKYICQDNVRGAYGENFMDVIKRVERQLENGNEGDYPVLKFFLQLMYDAFKSVDDLRVSNKGRRLSKREKIEREVLNSREPISKAEICKMLPDVSATTVEAVLGDLVSRGAVEKIGQGRGTKYLAK